jgi:hypothetical protein
MGTQIGADPAADRLERDLGTGPESVEQTDE